MTFTPTPKADLEPLTSLHEAWTDLSQQVLSRLHHAEEAANWAAAVIADIYERLPGLSASWYWSSTVAGDPGTGKVHIAVISGNERRITLSKIDREGDLRTLTLNPGGTVVLTDDPLTPPTTAFRQYLVTSDVLDHGNWVSFTAIRVATYGIQDSPTAGTPVRLLLR